jgi:predicted outer membrane repeat protein
VYNNEGATAVVNNSQIILNSATELFGGGGIVNLGELELNNSQVRANEANGGSGGGINNEGILRIQADSAINLNNSSGNGGGIYNSNGGQVYLTNSTIQGNSAAQDGGGIYSTALGSNLYLSNSLVDANTAEAGYGGGIAINHGNPPLTDMRISNNTSGQRGGGIAASYPLTLHGGTIRHNNAGGQGGGVEAGILTANNVIVAGNESATMGGGIYASLNLTLTNSQVVSNTAKNLGGGGIFLSSSDFTTTEIGNTAVAHNNAPDGGGIWVARPLTIYNSTISQNQATTNGSGLYIEETVVITATNITIANNMPGIDLYKMGDLRLQNSIISNPEQPNCIGSLTFPEISSLGNNLSDDNSCTGLDQPGDVVTADTLLEPLADNGGETLTHALQEGSPAIGGGNVAACSAAPVNGKDQRGFIRLANSCDMGAFDSKGMGTFIYLPLITR